MCAPKTINYIIYYQKRLLKLMLKSARRHTDYFNKMLFQSRASNLRNSVCSHEVQLLIKLIYEINSVKLQLKGCISDFQVKY